MVLRDAEVSLSVREFENTVRASIQYVRAAEALLNSKRRYAFTITVAA
jgi:hypothetical protein